ncbi:low molecular weight phosphatase family protein [Kitasatospora sp. NPDC048365]|uniref:arsenate reductase/protein-tyrosine-phosphatase family protein n=1 Tax=Kitasatospora sp. NPDC048365 TaxID=3364050 RepID=UPI003717DA1F
MTGFDVLFVCTGNLYRSTIAERLLAVRLGEQAGGFRIGSAGTQARPGAPMSPRAAAVIRELGGEAGEFESRRLTAELVASADLVLGLAREHREAAVRLRPTALRRCFSLEEFVRLGGGPHEDGGLHADGGAPGAVSRAAAQRGRAPAVAPGADDIEDPDGRSAEFLRSTAARIDRALQRVAALLTVRQDELLGC